MCGITGGTWSSEFARIDAPTLEAMTTAIAHRGPDDAQTWLSRLPANDSGRCAAALGFRRLSIIDLAGARQPMPNEDGSVRLVFNGEIYNFRDLRKRLEGGGHHFATQGDGESILHLYEDIGTDCFQHLNGMFAIGLWDANRNRLVIARDRIGQKPLYYAYDEHRMVFASELKCLAAIPGVCQTIDPSAIDDFLLYQYVPHPKTIWKGVYKLPPGHFAVYENGRLTVQRYWEFDPSHEAAMTHETAVETLQELLTDSVRLRLQSDVPLGSFLSGGIDSSLITALAQSQSASPVHTFSIGFSVAEFDETRYAAEVAEHLGTQHERFEVNPSGVDLLDKLVWHYDEPFGDSSAIPTWYLSELTKRKVTVALSGDGGDELFAGYERYRALWLSKHIQRCIPLHRVPGIGLVQRLPDSNRRRSIIRRGKRFLEALGQSSVRRYLNWLQIFPESLRASLYRDDFLVELPDEDPFEFLNQAWQRSAGRDVVTQASMSDVLTYLPCDLMTKVDIASMAHGLEVRQPLLDYRVVEHAASMPVQFKFRGSRGKLILRDAFGSMIPEAIWTRSKMGFGVPIAGWFRNELRERVRDTLLADDARIHAFMRSEAIQSLVDEHQAGAQNHGYRLWNLLILETWLRRWG